MSLVLAQEIVFILVGVTLVIVALIILLLVIAIFAGLTNMTWIESKCYLLCNTAFNLGLAIIICALFGQLSLIPSYAIK